MATAHSSFSSLTDDKESVKVFWLPKAICQSTEQRESKACILIALMMIHNCHKFKVKLSLNFPSAAFLDLFQQSIEQGNAIYESLKERRLLKEKYLNVPEALLAIAPNLSASLLEWESFFYNTNILDTLYTNMHENIKLWQKKKPMNKHSDLNVVIIANLRAVAVVLSRNANLVMLADSHAHWHGHWPYGAVIAMAHSTSLEELCRWYAKLLIKDTQPTPVKCYELSFLYCE